MAHNTLAALLTLCLIAVPSQEEAQEKPKTTKPFPRDFEEIAEGLQENLLGAWRLIEIFDPRGFIESKEIAGYAVFTEGFMALEFHIYLATDFGAEDRDTYYVTGTHRFEFDEAARLRTTSLIGTSNINPERRFRFERPGQVREYVVTVEGDELMLERDDENEARGSRFTFQRENPPYEKKVDFFGRPIREPATKEPKR